MRSQTHESYKERILQVLVHIQGHLDEALSLEDLAAVAHFSPYHFQRIFSAFMGEPVHGYIRRLRLERAAAMLKTQPKGSISEIALRSGYDTPSAFNKAFRKMFKISPRAFRKGHGSIPALAGHSAGISPAKGETGRLQPTYRKIEDWRVLFVRRQGPYDKAASAAWSALMRHAYRHGLIGPVDGI